jgi:hypothetical protein
MLVYRLAHYRNSIAQVIPPRVIERAPSAELRPDQKDSDSLPPYEVLDAILELFIEDNLSVDEISARGFDRATVGRVLEMVKRNEYKRRQAPPGVRISDRAFGRDWRYSDHVRIPHAVATRRAINCPARMPWFSSSSCRNRRPHIRNDLVPASRALPRQQRMECDPGARGVHGGAHAGQTGWSRACMPEIARPIRLYAVLEIMIGVGGFAMVALLPRLNGLFAVLFANVTDTPWLLNVTRLGIAFSFLVLPTTAMGATLPVLTDALSRSNANFGANLGDSTAGTRSARCWARSSPRPYWFAGSASLAPD